MSQSNNKNNSPAITLNLLFRQLIRGWYWFAISFVFYFIIVFAMSNRMVFGTSKYKMSIMTQYGDISDGKIVENKSTQTLWSREPAYTPEQIYGILLSSDIIYRAGKRVGFDVDYYQKSRFRTCDVYNDLPFSLRFLDAYENDTFTIKALWQDNESVKLSDFNGFLAGNNITQSVKGSDAIITLGDTIRTPFGRIACLPSPSNSTLPRTSLNLNEPVIVKKVNTNWAKSRYDKDTDLQVDKKRTLTLSIAVAGSAKRVLEVLNEVIVLCEEDVHNIIEKDLQENDYFFKQALHRLDSLQIDPIAKAKEREELLQELARNESNKTALNVVNNIVVTDPPSLRSASFAGSYFKIILFLIALVIPTLVIYFTRIARGVILDEDQLPTSLKQKPISRLTYSTLRKGEPSQMQLYDIDKLRITLEGANQVFLFATAKPRESLWLSHLLAQNIAHSGKRAIRLHYCINENNKPSGCQSIVAQAGYIGSTAFWQDLNNIKAQLGNNTFVVITADKQLQEQLLPLFTDVIVVIVREKTMRETLLELNHILSNSTFANNERTLHTTWIKLPLSISTRK